MNPIFSIILSLVPFFVIIVNCLPPPATNQKNSNYVKDETGYNFEAYPSLFTAVGDSILQSPLETLESTILSSIGLDTLAATTSLKTFSVDRYGAKGDGTHDDTQAFQKAWKQACSSSGAAFVVPKNKKYLVKPVTFSGPCKSKLHVKIYGTIIASADRSVYNQDRKHWIVFERVQNLVVEGGGIVDGNGKIWWQNSCKRNKALPCKSAPTALTFYDCKNLNVNNLKIRDSQQMHVRFEKCEHVTASHLVVSAPGDSPNTDGIHLTSTQNIELSNIDIATGDDCISIVSGSKNVKAKNINCGPGHGISIGSLGAHNAKAFVSNVTVDGAHINGATNGVRIKTYQGGSGSVSQIKFLNIQMDNVKNPIIIDQNYCDQAKPCKQQGSAVQVQDVLYQNIRGTSANTAAITFECSKNYPCQGIVLQEVNLVTRTKARVEAVCQNVKSKEKGTVSPRCH